MRTRQSRHVETRVKWRSTK